MGEKIYMISSAKLEKFRLGGEKEDSKAYSDFVEENKIQFTYEHAVRITNIKSPRNGGWVIVDANYKMNENGIIVRNYSRKTKKSTKE